MYHHRYSLQVVPMHQPSRVSHQPQAGHLAREAIQVRQRKVPIRVLLKVCQEQVDHQMDRQLGQRRLPVEVLPFLEEIQHPHHLVYNRRVTILNIAPDLQGHPVNVRSRY